MLLERPRKKGALAYSESGRDPAYILACAALALSILVPITWGVSFHSPWDVDNLAPGPVLRVMSSHFAPGWHSSYGPVPYLVLALVCAPILVGFKLVGELGRPSAIYPWGFVHPSFAILMLTVAARLVSAAMAFQIARLAAWRAKEEVSPPPNWCVVLLLLGSPTFAYYAHTSNVDLHYLFWLWAAFHLIETRLASVRGLAVGAACAALAVCSKEQAAPFAIVACLAAIMRAGRNQKRSAARWRAAALIAAVPLVTYAIAWQLPFNFSGWLAHHRFLFGQARYPRTFPLTPAGMLGLAGRTIHLFPVALGPLLLIVVAISLVLRSSWRGLGLRALGCAFYLGGFVISIGYVYPRFLLPLLLLLVPLGARGVRDLATLSRAGPRGRRALLTSAVLLALAGAPALSLAMLSDPRLALERWMRRAPAGESFEIVGNPAFQARVPPDRRVLRTNVDSLGASRGPRGDVVLTSSIDVYRFQSDARVRAAWWDSLQSLASSGRRREIVFGPDPAQRFCRGLPIAATVSAWVRAPSEGP